MWKQENFWVIDRSGIAHIYVYINNTSAGFEFAENNERIRNVSGIGKGNVHIHWHNTS